MSKTVIIGGVAGGATAAARLRRRDESMEIVMLEKGEYISFANCGLPYYIGDVIHSRESLLLQTPERMKKKFNIDVRICQEAAAVRPEENIVTVRNLKTGETYEENYDNLIIATGSSPLKPGIPGIDGSRIFTIWNIADTDRIKEFMEKEKPESAAVIGGGFIGLEMAENLHRAGLSLSVIEMQKQVMAPLDYEMARLLHENMEMNGVELILEDGVKQFCQKENQVELLLASGKTIRTDMVILSIGVRPNSRLASEAGLALNARGGILVNEFLQTSVPNIYAAGDVIEVEQLVSGERTMIPLAGPANKQARICADNIAGDRKHYEGSLGTSAAQCFDLTAAAVGLNEKALLASGKIKGRDYHTILIQQKSHAGYYPGAYPLTLKLLFDPDSRILGAQIVGQEGVDKRIDTIASVMRLSGTTDDLTKLELAYAPPFSSAKDPVNMAGFTAENVRKGLVSFLGVQELESIQADEKKRDDCQILDVTEAAERLVFAVPGSVHIPLGELRERMEELDPGKLIIPYCSVGVRSYNAARILMQSGFKRVKVLEGGTTFYKSYHYKNYRMAEAVDKTMRERNDKQEKRVLELDCSGLQCPGPIMKVNETLRDMEEGERLCVAATDLGFARDISAWCSRTGNTLAASEKDGKQIRVTIEKGNGEKGSGKAAETGCSVREDGNPAAEREGKTIIVFDGDLDKVLAAFIIANGAAAMGRPVTMFFTFWGLNALRRPDKVKVKKPFLDRMFGMMMPRGTGKLKLSNMNMGGMGTRLMKKVMRDKNVSSLEELMKQAMAQGVRLVACTMSMDVMGITREELIDGVELAGVASYLGDAELSNVNLFV